jgi:hypothetical protein
MTVALVSLLALTAFLGLFAGAQYELADRQDLPCGTATVIGSAAPATASVTSITRVYSPVATEVRLFSHLHTAHMSTTMFDAQEPCLMPARICPAVDVLDSLNTAYDPCETSTILPVSRYFFHSGLLISQYHPF